MVAAFLVLSLICRENRRKMTGSLPEHLWAYHYFSVPG